MNHHAVALSFVSCFALGLSWGCSSSSSAGGGTCSVTTGSGGTALACVETIGDTACNGDEKAAPCSSTGLVGCCKTVNASITTYTCTYSSETKSTIMETCTMEKGSWVTSL